MARLYTLAKRNTGVHNDLQGQNSPVIYEEVGTIAFTTTGTTVEYTSQLTTIDNVIAIPNDASAAGEQIGAEVSGSVVTFSRQTGTTSGLVIYYRILGRK